MELIEIFWYILLIGVETTNHLNFCKNILYFKGVKFLV